MEPFLDASPEFLWGYLQKICNDSSNPARVITLANVDSTGLPQARSVILREVEPWCLKVYTDRRSPKVTQLQHQPDAQLLIWDAQRRWQLRVTAQTEVLTKGAAVEQLWQQIANTHAAQDYLTPQPPGAPLDAVAPAEAEPQLAILQFNVNAIDWLELRREGHRRQRLTPEGVQALVP